MQEMLEPAGYKPYRSTVQVALTREASIPRLYLHAGLHKTGTTALQAFAAHHRETLRGRGLLYPDLTPLKRQPVVAHNAFAHGLSDTQENRLPLAHAKAMPHLWLGEALKENLGVLVSSEALCRQLTGQQGAWLPRRKGYLMRLAETLSNFEVIPILVFRRPDNYIRSSYQENVASACEPLDFTSHRDWAAKRLLQYTLTAEMFAEILGKPRCLIYEDLQNSGRFFSEFFARTTGTDVSDLSEPGRVRESLSVPQTVAKNFLNGFAKTKSQSKQLGVWLRQEEVANRVHAEFGGRDFDLWRDTRERADFLRSREADLETLRQCFFGGQEALFPPLTETECRPPVPALPASLRHYLQAHVETAFRLPEPPPSPWRSRLRALTRYVPRQRRS